MERDPLPGRGPRLARWRRLWAGLERAVEILERPDVAAPSVDVKAIRKAIRRLERFLRAAAHRRRKGAPLPAEPISAAGLEFLRRELEIAALELDSAEEWRRAPFGPGPAGRTVRGGAVSGVTGEDT